MISCRQCSNRMIDALYGDLESGDKKKFEQHLQTCPGCAARYHKLLRTVTAVNNRQRREPDQQFWDGYWENLADKLQSKKRFRAEIREWWQRVQDWFLIEQRWVYRFAGAIALILVGIVIGKFYFSGSDSKIESKLMPMADLQQRSAVQVRADRYIERSKILLLGLINFEPETEDAYALNLPRQKKISRELVQEAGVLKSELSGHADEQLKQLVVDLEVILLQIANLEAEFDLTGIEIVRSGVDRRGILLKINLEEMQQVSQQAKQKITTDEKNKRKHI